MAAMCLHNFRNFRFVLLILIFRIGIGCESASTDIELDAKARALHRVDSLNLLVYTLLLILTVLTIWLFKHRRFRFLHETGLAVIYGLIIGALIRYTGSSNSVTHVSVHPNNNTKYNLSVPPDTLWFKFPNKVVNANVIPSKTYAYTFRGEIMDVENSEIDLKATFDPEIFFNIILPPIIFHAGYSLKRRYFFRNLGAILTYAMIGTTISSFVVGSMMYGLIQITPHLKTSFTFLDTLYFGALISSTDPLTILAIFNDLQVDVNLYALVFGESVLNDAVSIVLSGAIQNYGKKYQSNESEFETYAFFRAFGDFIGIFSLSLIIGAFMGCVTALLAKFTRVRDFPLLESALFVLMSYSTFLIAEACDLTGVVAVLFCGICQAHYTYNNLSDNSRTRTKHLFQLLNFLAENFIFCYIGVSMFTFPKHHFDPFFIFSGFICAAIGRAANIYPLSFLLNLGRKPKISANFQHMLFFAGLRGAMSFALAIRNTVSEARQAMLTTTSLIVIVTVIIQGGATMQLLTWFNIPVGVEEEVEMFPYAGVRHVYNSMGSPETAEGGESSSHSVSGKQVNDKAFLARIWGDFDTKYMKPFLTDSRPTLLETLPVCCNPIARLLTTTTQLTQENRSRSRHDSDSDVCLEENGVRRSSRSSLPRVMAAADMLAKRLESPQKLHSYIHVKQKDIIMESRVGRSASASITKILCIIFIIFQLSDLVICGDPDDDSLQNALDFVERRQRDLQLQDGENYGQPEDIGYGYQKVFGIFDDGPARELGSPDSDPEGDNDLRNLLNMYTNYQRESDDDSTSSMYNNKRKSNFRERYATSGDLVSDKDIENGQDPSRYIYCSYMNTLKGLWCNYRQSLPEDATLEDLTPDQVTEILGDLVDKDPDESYDPSSVYNEQYGGIPLRSRRNYRVFDRLNEKKRYPSFGEGFYGKRHSQRINYENPSENDFLYALKFVNPDKNREAVENLKDTGYDVLGDEKDRDVMRMLNDAVMSNSRSPQDEEPYWMRKEQQQPQEGVWLLGPVDLSSDDSSYQDAYTAEKRTAPKIFKTHNGIHLNNKRIPVKRSPVRAKKEAAKASKEVKGIFEVHQTTTAVPKSTKKPTEVAKKQNATKPEVTKHRDVKKLVRRANDYTKEQIYSPSSGNSEIEKIFNVQKVDKKSIDWSQYFGYDKRSARDWLWDDSLRRAESLFLTPKHKRYSPRDKSQYEAPFDTRIFNSKKVSSYAVDKNIDRMERKLGSIEDRIIDDAVKYTGAHTGGANEDLRQVKNEIVHHLEAAYSLEKMKNALEEFKNSMKSEKSGFSGMEEVQKKAGTESPRAEAQATTVRAEKAKNEKVDTDKSKRVSTKKEIEDVYGKDSLEFLNWPTEKERFPDSSEECPVVDKSLSNCRRVSEITGRFTDVLLPICSLQQICYMCGSEIGFSRPSACDLMYLTEAENLCQGNRACLLSARDSMLALRDIREQEVIIGSADNRASGSCLLNPCIQKYFMNTPAAVVPLEYQE